MFLHFVKVFAQAPPASNLRVHLSLLLVTFFVWLEVEHLHDAIVWEVAIITKELLHQDLKAFESRGCLENIDGSTQDVSGQVHSGTSWEVAVRVINHVTLRRSTSAKNVCYRQTKVLEEAFIKIHHCACLFLFRFECQLYLCMIGIITHTLQRTQPLFYPSLKANLLSDCCNPCSIRVINDFFSDVSLTIHPGDKVFCDLVNRTQM